MRYLAVAFVTGLLTSYAASAHADLGDCSQPVSNQATPAASDCLFILRVAISLESCTPEPCVCDPNGDDNTSASDALTCLKIAVGESIPLLCPCSTSNCSNDGNCSNDECVCSDCDDDFFCGEPSNCGNDGTCRPFLEGCVCEDCVTHPECLDN